MAYLLPKLRGTKVEDIKQLLDADAFNHASGDNWSRCGKMQMMQKEYSMVHVPWSATFEKTGDKPIEFDVTYILQNTH